MRHINQWRIVRGIFSKLIFDNRIRIDYNTLFSEFWIILQDGNSPIFTIFESIEAFEYISIKEI